APVKGSVRDRCCGRGYSFPAVFFVRRPFAVRLTWCRLMRTFGQQAAYVVMHPGSFTLCVLRAFRKNQGLLLAGAVAYYALLSIVPLLILIVIGLSHLIEQALLLETLDRYLAWLVPGQSKALVAELVHFLEHRDVIGWVLLAT